MKLTIEQLKEFVDRVDKCGPGTLGSVSATFKENGIVANMHVGRPQEDFTDKITTEWFLGQFVSMVENDGLIGMNAWINCADKFILSDIELTHFDEGLFEFEV